MHHIPQFIQYTLMSFSNVQGLFTKSIHVCNNDFTIFFIFSNLNLKYNLKQFGYVHYTDTY